MARNKVQFQKGLSEAQFAVLYGTEDQCREAVMRWRGPSGFVCPVCAGEHHSFIKTRALYQCAACRRQTSVIAGTIFAATKVPLCTWFRAMYHLTQSKGGISSIELGRRLGVTQTTAWKIKHKLMQGMMERDATKRLTQGCSTLLTDSQREYCVETTECGGVSVLIECIVLIASENVVSEAAHAGEDAGVVADARAVFEKGDIARVMQLVFDVPVAADGSGKAACRSLGVSQVVGDLAGAGPQTGPGPAMQHIAVDADDLLDQRLPLGADPCLGGFEHLGGPGFVLLVAG